MKSIVMWCLLALAVTGRAALAQESLPLVYVLSTGGTIAGRGASTTAGSDYERGAVLGEELVGRVPEITSHRTACSPEAAVPAPRASPRGLEGPAR